MTNLELSRYTAKKEVVCNVHAQRGGARSVAVTGGSERNAWSSMNEFDMWLRAMPLDSWGKTDGIAPTRARPRYPRVRREAVVLFVGVCVFLIAACGGPQSALAPAGVGAERLARLFWAMLIAAALIWVLVMGLAVYATRINPGTHSERTANRLIIWGGVAFPITVLAILLAYGLTLMPNLRAEGQGLNVAVSGEQWWWRVRYSPPGADRPIASANEIRVPVGGRVEVTLTSPDVLHSFWIPTLAGKVDMIPGRTNRILLEPTKIGVYRGVCAEYCGASHALMAFSVVVMGRDAFAAWLARERQSATTPTAVKLKSGRRLFLATGCGACHTIRGTRAAGVIGPDLTHVGGRKTIGAGILPNETYAFMRWIAHTGRIKPGVRMPAFGMLPDKELRAIAAYLESLK